VGARGRAHLASLSQKTVSQRGGCGTFLRGQCARSGLPLSDTTPALAQQPCLLGDVLVRGR